MAILSTLTDPLPYHLLSYGTLLGSQIYQTFVLTRITFRALPDREFLLLQKRLFPVYFRCQLGLALLSATTRPPSLPGRAWYRHPWAWNWDSVPLAIVGATGLLNWLVYGPGCSRAVAARWLLQDAKSNGDKVVDEEAVRRATMKFSRHHARTIHLNVIALIATVWYVFGLVGGGALDRVGGLL
ncbi:hypothetical protein BDW62DRAFT_64269 [Aspergillus aurantiobrunneus]